MRYTGGPALPTWSSRPIRAWRALLLLAGTTLGLAVAPPRLALGADTGRSGENGLPPAGAAAPASDQEPASPPGREQGRLWHPVAVENLVPVHGAS